MGTVLFISNITYKITSFSSSSIYATHKMGMRFIHAANWSKASAEQIELFEKENDITICNVPISRSPFSLSNIESFKKLCRIVKDNNVEYIHCNTPVGGLLGRLAGKKCKVKKIIYQAHGFHFYKGSPKKNWLIYYPIERWLAHYTDILITINSEDYELSKTKFKLHNGGKVYYIPGVGIDLTQYELPDNVRKIKRTELGLKGTDIALISAGELNENKNNKIIIQALSELKNNNIHYIICGVGPKYSELKKIVSDNNLDDFVHFLGYRNDIKELYKACDIFVMPSFREGLSRSMMEAMACGLPCIASKIRGNVDLIKNGNGGYLLSPEDVNGFAQSIMALSNNELLRKQMGGYNLDVIKKYDIEVVKKEIEEIYREVLN